MEKNKWINGAIPALLIHCSIGTVYCWSTFKQQIAETIGASPFAVGWAFSLAIFFLGTSAAFMGKFIEKDVTQSAKLACWLFVLGMLGTGVTLCSFHGTAAVILIYLFYGVIMGCGLGIGYLTPVKTLMLWFPEQKGLATGISIMGFGLAKVIATPLMEFLQSKYGISEMFCILAFIYFITMSLGATLIKKPSWWSENELKYSDFSIKKTISNKTFICIWLMFYINIHCGLMIISYEKQIVNAYFYRNKLLPVLIVIVPSITAMCNALGRIGYSTISDKMHDRALVYDYIFCSCIIVAAIANIGMIYDLSYVPIAIILLLMTVNLGYGGGFSTLPALLSQRFGMNNISKIHGLALTAWAIAGLTGNNLSELLLKISGHYYGVITAVIQILYSIAFFISCTVKAERIKGD